IFLSADYIASMFKVYGLKPAGDMKAPDFRGYRRGSPRPTPQKSYFQNIPMVKTTPGDVQEFAVITQAGKGAQAVSFNYETDFSVQAGEVGTEFTAPVVFVGYGLVNEEKGYNDYDGIDVKGKVIVKIAGFPGHKDTSSPAYEKFKPETPQGGNTRMTRNRRGGGGGGNANEAGALGVITINPNSNPTLGWTKNVYPERYKDRSGYEGDVPMEPSYRLSIPGETIRAGAARITLTMRAANEILRNSGLDLEAWEKDVAEKIKGNPMDLAGKYIKMKTTVKSEMVKTRNVVGMIEGEDPSKIVVVGAHYDHLGKRSGYIYDGADDNGSGTVGVMTIARACAATGKKPKYTIVFAAWTGEEKGLLGSRYYATHPPVPIKDVLFNLNMDMISRSIATDTAKVMCGVQFTNAYPMLQTMTEDVNKQYKLGLKLNFRGSEVPSGGSDFASFARVGVPVIGLMAAMHPEYHTPKDELGLIEWDKMTNIIRFAYVDVWRIANGALKK
ncbi:M20/M25/M40 family metallo-hydrolase, partial [Bacteroidota bacterium]